MRIRYLKPSFFLNENLAELPFEFRLIYAGLWCCADREGRLENRDKRLKAEIIPYDNVDMAKAIKALTDCGFLTLYENAGTQYIQCEKWEIHQRIHHTEKDSIIPSYNDIGSIIKGNREGKGKAGKGKQETPHGEIPVITPLIDKNKYKTDSFIKFWELYPYRKGGKLGKKQCLDFWDKLKKETIPKILIGVKNYSECKQVKDGFAKDPIRFLKHEIWQDFQEEEKSEFLRELEKRGEQ